MDIIADAVGNISNQMWSWVLAPLVALVALYLTVRSGIVQFRWIPEMFRAVTDRSPLGDDGRPQSISAFQAFTLSAASRVGVGNIAGVGTAIFLGGPGAVFWMWLMALVVGATSLVESSLAQLFKVRDPGRAFRGGPAYYIQKGLGQRWAAILFAVFLILCFPFAFNSLQANTLAATIVGVSGAEDAPWWIPFVVGAVVAILTALVIFGGVHRIATVSQSAIPIVAFAYLMVGIIIVGINAQNLPSAVASIFTEAWGTQQVAGATLGVIIMNGVRRGMFSNEAGMGSVPNAAATAAVTHPVKQGLVQTLGVYFDTWLVCSITAFIILVSAPDLSTAQQGVFLTQNALASALGDWTGILLAVIIFLLAFTSVLGNYYYGESNLQFITSHPRALPVFRVLVIVAVFLGSIASADLIWNLADIVMGLMAFINLIAVTLLSPIAVRLIKDYTRQRRAGRDPVFTRDLLPDIGGIECWEDELSVTGPLGVISQRARGEKHRDHLHHTGVQG
ncbi:alanine:cation symporter family protein [Microbacterium protaetiae]|uniref:Alanine:cation symporter family protein n=1 Tax=Microbacterium protaetiae TaxID=2509458 RepID=A0A4V0YDH6_9MICO|nr:alanine/glycine:cation symporter family protein [Microbacterium protaetiae]QAY60741.1 alanine:cation symporter family protein [Microbacterium protaetiae]